MGDRDEENILNMERQSNYQLNFFGGEGNDLHTDIKITISFTTSVPLNEKYILSFCFLIFFMLLILPHNHPFPTHSLQK
jgi:hypothetical protein